MTGMFFDDFMVGQIFESEDTEVSKANILSFATAFDPNPFHLDEAAALRLGFPDVIASGMHTLSLSMKLFFELNLWDEAVLPSPGLENVRWHRPVVPGTRLYVRATVSETLASKSKPDRGIIKIRQDTLDKADDCVLMSVDVLHRLKRRHQAPILDAQRGVDEAGKTS